MDAREVPGECSVINRNLRIYSNAHTAITTRQ
jgi:hypothetical protein